MGKLHELLAVEGQLEGKAKKIIDETTSTFKNKPNIFYGGDKICEMYAENDQNKATPPTHQKMETTVNDKLDYTIKSIVQYIDVMSQKEKTNQIAKADLVVDGATILKDVPATLLLGLERRLNTWRDLFVSIPTLQVGVDYKKDKTLGKNVWKQKNPKETLRTAKTFQYKVLYEATDKHPAQIEKWEEQTPVGKYIENTWAGVLSSAEKFVILDRFDKLLIEVKKARQRANNTAVVKINVGDSIFKYIMSN